MSNLILYLNGLAIPTADVIKWPLISESLSYDSAFNVPDSATFEINNSRPERYDPKYAGSLLNGTQVLGLPVSLYDPDISQTIMRGVVKNVQTSLNDRRMTLETTSQLSTIAELDAELVDTGITPAEAVYKLMTAKKTLVSSTPVIDPSYIDTVSYRYASTYQEQRRITIDIAVYKGGQEKKKYSDIITELNKIGHMNVYAHYDKIYFWVYDARVNPSIIIDKYIAGTYRDGYSLDESMKVKNSCSVVYKNGASVAYYSAKDDASIEKYGESIFGIPTDDVDSDASTDFSSLIDNYIGAKNCGDLAIARRKTPAFMCDVSLEWKYYFLKVGDIIGFNFGPFAGLNTPVRIMEADYDRGDRVAIKGLFL